MHEVSLLLILPMRRIPTFTRPFVSRAGHSSSNSWWVASVRFGLGCTTLLWCTRAIAEGGPKGYAVRWPVPLPCALKIADLTTCG
jgi:hypothetical protein